MDYLEGLTRVSITDVEKRIGLIKETHLKTTRLIAQELFTLKGIFDKAGDNNWVAFCQSDALPLGERSIYDLVRAHPWLDQTELKDDFLSSLSVRVMGEMGKLLEASEEDEQAEELLRQLEGRMLAGEVITAAELARSKGSEPKQPTNYKALYTQFKSDWEKVSKMLDWYRERLHYLEKTIGHDPSIYPEQEEMDRIDASDPLWKVTVSNTKKRGIKNRATALV